MDSDHGVKGKCGVEASRRPEAGAPLDLEELRERLRRKRGPELWRSLEELAGTPEFADMLHREFPRQASEWPEGVSRRNFLQLASASLALAGLTGCTKQPIEKIVPYVRKPEQLIPGKPLFFATALTHGGYATGVLAESHMGRPTKIEGNPDHPASLGATDVFAQAAVLTLYDPARSQAITHGGRTTTWSAFTTELGEQLRAQEALGGTGIRLLTGTVTSPTLAEQIQQLRTRFPRMAWHRWEPAGERQSFVASLRAFGRPVETRYDFTKADVVLAIDSDVLTRSAGSTRYQRDFASRRYVRSNQPRANQPQQPVSRVYCVESLPTNTSTVADHRLQLAPADVEAFVLALAQGLGVAGGAPQTLPQKAVEWLKAVTADLQAAPGRSLVVGDEYLSPAMQVLLHGINQRLGAVGSTVLYSEPVEVDPVDHLVSLTGLVQDMNAGRVEILVMLGVNPVYTAPADLGFAAALAKVPLRIHHGLYEDETSERCHWHIPAAHELESWGDARAFDGTVSIIQPLIEPLFEGKSVHELLALLAKQPGVTGYDIVRQHWQPLLGGDFEAAWHKALHDGLLPDTQAAPAGVAVAGGAVQQAAAEVAGSVARTRAQQDQVRLCFRPDPTIWDGRHATNVWLQELPKPITKLVWDNAVIIGPVTAAKLELAHEEPVEVTWKDRKLRAAVWVQPGVAPGVASLSLGYGRTRKGDGDQDEEKTGQGFNAYALRTSDALWTAPGVTIRGLGGRYVFACTQNHHAIESGIQSISPQGEISEDSEVRKASEEAERRHILRVGTLREMRADPDFIEKEGEEPPAEMTMYPRYEYKGHAWGMAIDLNVCTGCSSCVVACQAENNIPVVGKEQVLRGREMHWLRIDRYFYGDFEEPAIHNQPVPCMQCENAPCEVVCPVAATSHSDEGLNDMVYNRCVGTRYCSNNCPYKVRRFNFLRFSERESPLYRMLYNPDVTVRMRGVMEKCTYCVQRIEQAKIESKVESQPIPPNRLQTACQQACPTQAIAFGDINDGEWDVTRWKADKLNYAMLEELNTRPRTTYLAKVRNTHPAIDAIEAIEQRGAAERTDDGHS
ncbi:MAG TPA: TAT-variant-translocated molybdopterin oxidoreductase [Thermoanaerobaculia bacterium]|nr:TAT-variant-translocated molybdopterin oxidoreductase [Thermoanaerobaculia bacterium]